MINKIKYFILLLCLTFVGCSNNPEQLKEYINGYWEITKVEKNGNLIKTYNINPTVDYFELSSDTIGFRKKVTPTFEGTFIVTKHNAAFTMKIENDSLNIYYTNNGLTTKETIVKATQTKLIITNAEGFKYSYKPFEKIDINSL